MAERKSGVIRASEISAYLFCERAWWYQRQGHVPENQAEMRSGTALHNRHARAVWQARLTLTAGAILLLAALVLLVLAFFHPV